MNKHQRVISFVAMVASTCASLAAHSAPPSREGIYLDRPLPAPKSVLTIQHRVCDSSGLCTTETSLFVTCQNGTRMKAMLIQPVRGSASVEFAQIGAQATMPAVLQKVNNALRLKPENARIEVTGYCGSTSGSLIYTAYLLGVSKPTSGPDILIYRKERTGPYEMGTRSFPGSEPGSSSKRNLIRAHPQP